MSDSLSFITTDKAPAAIGAYSQGVLAGNWLFVSGQLGLDPSSGAFVSDDFVPQLRQALHNVKSILQAAGLGINDIAAIDVFLADMKNFKELNKIYQEFMGEHKPARAVVEVAALPMNALVEIKCVGIKK